MGNVSIEGRVGDSRLAPVQTAERFGIELPTEHRNKLPNGNATIKRNVAYLRLST
jgi:hypothetical protein